MDNAMKMAPVLGIVALCAALGLSRATFYRHQRAPALVAPVTAPQAPPAVAALCESVETSGRSPVAVCGHGTEGATVPPAAPGLVADGDAARNGAEPAPIERGAPDLATTPAVAPATEPDQPPAKKPPPRKLSDEERATVLAALNEDRFCNLAPAEVYATLLDESKYLCSERTMYRILDENRQVRERRNQLRHPTYVAPELMAKKPNQLWSWDITKLKTFVKSQYLHLYVILDVYSRYVVGWMVAEREAGELAKALIDETCERQGIKPGELTFHADNGAAMTAQPVAFLLASMGITKSHSRPHVSDDNPFSEAQFKTLKYRPDFPERFASLEHARTFLRAFFDWYNNQHHHDALALMTPHDVHHGLVQERLAQRKLVLDAAYAAHPDRFVRRPPAPAAPPDTVWINPPKPPPAAQETRA
jgi:putative transposase